MCLYYGAIRDYMLCPSLRFNRLQERPVSRAASHHGGQLGSRNREGGGWGWGGGWGGGLRGL